MKTRFKVYAVCLILLCVLEYFNLRNTAGFGEVTPDRVHKASYVDMDRFIANVINQRKITLYVDGKCEENTKVYVSDRRSYYLPVDVFTKNFSCACFFLDSKLILEKGESKVVVAEGEDRILINDRYISLEEPIIICDDIRYVNIEILKLALGYTSAFDYQSNTLSLENIRLDSEIFPVKYDYREEGRMVGIKDQGTHSTCWAFASLSALESTLAPERIKLYSEKNMTLNNGYVISLKSGGDYTMAMAYLAAWRGPILSSFEEGYGEYETPFDAPVDVHVQEIQTIASKDYDSIKRAVFLHGGVESTLYMAIDANNLNSYYYNKETNSYCYQGDERPNHDIVIVGWDDTYPKENFNKVPEGDGAFICQNSWGEDFGDDGVFYVSYYDTLIGISNTAYTRVDEADNYDNIYQSDICGMVGQLGYEGEDAYFANVYTVRKDEYLRAVSFYATGKNAEYDIYLVEDFVDETSFDKKKFLMKGTFDNAGYYTVDLPEGVMLEEGHSYGVVVKIRVPNSERPIAIEYHKGYDTSNVDISDGRGYISFAGKVWERTEETKNCNICLKMFTDNVEE